MSTSAKPPKKYNSKNILSQDVDPAISNGHLNVSRFVEARKFEILQMESAMKRSKQSSKKRAFQSMPRFLRRRTASHNVKRVPKRIRKQALDEMDPMTAGKKRVSGKDRRKSIAIQTALESQKQTKLLNHEEKDHLDDQLDRDAMDYCLTTGDLTGINTLAKPPVSSNVKYAKRQKNNVWLPTHVWQAKRAHMVKKWDYCIAETPTEKVYRATHRISTAGTAIAWDTSYYGSIILSGRTDELKLVIAKLTGENSSISSPVVKGVKCWDGVAKDYCLGPILVFWSSDSRQALINVHPAIFEKAYSVVLAFKQDNELYFDIHDCRYSVGSISVSGSKALFALTSILHPGKSEETTAELLQKLHSVANPSALPSNFCASLLVQDPRFYSPHHIKGITKDAAVDVTIDTWSQNLAASNDLFTLDGRSHSYINQSTIKMLNARRADTDPGDPIQATDEDPLIPVNIVKRSDDLFSLFMPWNWVLPFWISLMHVDKVRIGGMAQMHQLAFEQGKPFFPDDFPNTSTGAQHEVDRSLAYYESWKRKPKSKRINFALTPSPVTNSTSEFQEIGKFYSCDWDFLASMHNIEIEEIHLSKLHLQCIRRGTPKMAARVYIIPEEEKELWLSGLNPGEEKWPQEKHLVGFVTTGSFNLKDGTGSCIANVLTSSINNTTKVKGKPAFLIRNVGSRVPVVSTT